MEAIHSEKEGAASSAGNNHVKHGSEAQPAQKQESNARALEQRRLADIEGDVHGSEEQQQHDDEADGAEEGQDEDGEESGQDGGDGMYQGQGGGNTKERERERDEEDDDLRKAAWEVLDTARVILRR